MNRLFTTIGVGFLVLAITDGSAFANCKPGTSHCVTASSSIPKFCGSVSKPCTIDGGLGGTCKGDICGTGPTGPEGNPYFPYSFGNEHSASLGTSQPSGGGSSSGFTVSSGLTHATFRSR